MRKYHLALYIPETGATLAGVASASASAVGRLTERLDDIERVLEWNGADYVARSGRPLKARTDIIKRFIGPVDPATVSGVVLGANDAWDQV